MDEGMDEGVDEGMLPPPPPVAHRPPVMNAPSTPERAAKEEFVRSPSVQYDLDAGVPIVVASRAQRVRSQLRKLDAELAVLRAEVTRNYSDQSPLSSLSLSCQRRVRQRADAESGWSEQGARC